MDLRATEYLQAKVAAVPSQMAPTRWHSGEMVFPRALTGGGGMPDLRASVPAVGMRAKPNLAMSAAAMQSRAQQGAGLMENRFEGLPAPQARAIGSHSGSALHVAGDEPHPLVFDPAGGLRATSSRRGHAGAYEDQPHPSSTATTQALPAMPSHPATSWLGTAGKAIQRVFTPATRPALP
jgi:hypothetical protein